MQLQPVPEQTETNLIPFDYHYSPLIEYFLKTVTLKFELNLKSFLKIRLTSIAPSRRTNVFSDMCETEKISEPPSYQLSVSSSENCETACRQNNKEFVKLLNKNIYIISNTLFIDASLYVIKLNPIDSDNGGCVKDENKNTFQCICKLNYQILVNTEFHRIFQLIFTDIPFSRPIQTRDKFSALVILLKFYPLNAVFYLAYMFEINKEFSNPYPSHFVPNDIMHINFDGEIVSENVSGTLEDRGQFSEYGNTLFMKICNLVAHGDCDLRAIGNSYYSINKF